MEVLGLEAVVSSDGPVGVLCEPPVPYLILPLLSAFIAGLGDPCDTAVESAVRRQNYSL
jgi:hypothetical protein